ncbi:hypothetical protein QQF64_014230 [Cirrhinus molitorella]|uniref:Uncharacterized protein n=1 Tax=Cirrhinus molitorella TaxID=172907 RepID=A0ABR3LWU9_9TELE
MITHNTLSGCHRRIVACRVVIKLDPFPHKLTKSRIERKRADRCGAVLCGFRRRVTGIHLRSLRGQVSAGSAGMPLKVESHLRWFCEGDGWFYYLENMDASGMPCSLINVKNEMRFMPSVLDEQKTNRQNA